jgi:hypothetical protein
MNLEFKLISPTDSIGNTLSTLNENYTKLQTWFDSIALSANNYWKPVVEFYKDFSPRLKSNISLGSQNLDSWIDTSTTVEYNSARWIEPLVIYYPFVITLQNQGNMQSQYNTITTWLNNKFPVLNSNCKNGVCYVENTKCYVYLMLEQNSKSDIVNFFSNRFLEENKRSQPTDGTTCTTSDTTGTAGCSQCYSGSVGCGGKGTFRCNGCRSCNISSPVTCNFLENNSKRKPVKIVADIFYNYTDNFLDPFMILNYTVSNCKWLLKS